MHGWYFRPKVKGENNREPIYGEFFATDAISDPGMALVREGIQNSLDAGRPGEKVMVRIYLSGDTNHPKATKVARYFDRAWEHVNAKDNGLHPDEVPSEDDACTFLAFEDFGTRGLEGDPAEAFRNKDGKKNHFYHFFRAEGQSDKESSDRGSWGVGKQVFPRSSRVSGLFGVTVRADDRKRLLMGRLVLKSHWVDDDYCQDGYFGVVPGPHQGDDLVMPVDDTVEIESFCTLFGLQRGNDPGLSIVVPWPDALISEKALVKAVLADYFYPILDGTLEVLVETPGVETLLDNHSIIEEASKLGSELSGDLPPFLELANWARQVPADAKTTIAMSEADRGWNWSANLISPEHTELLRESFYRGDNIAIRVPVIVRKKRDEPEESFFDVYLVRDESDQTGRPKFIREGVIISKVDSPKTRGVRALIIVDDLPLAAFLRDAENPSHTEWQHEGSNFRGKYKSGKGDLNFVKRSVHEIVRIITEGEREEDPTLLIDMFSLPAPPEEDSVKTKARKGGKKTTEPPPPPPPPKPRRFRVEKTRGGFAILPGETGTTAPAFIDVHVAYDVRRGNPIKRYNPADFDLTKQPIRFDPEPRGVDIKECIENRILIAITEPEFSLHVAGFDERRDLYIRATPKELVDGGSAS